MIDEGENKSFTESVKGSSDKSKIDYIYIHELMCHSTICDIYFECHHVIFQIIDIFKIYNSITIFCPMKMLDKRIICINVLVPRFVSC